MTDETGRPRRADRHQRSGRAGQGVPNAAASEEALPLEPSSPRRARRAPRTPTSRGVRTVDARTRRRTLVGVVTLVALTLAVCVPGYTAWRMFMTAEVGTSAGEPVTIEIPAGSGTAAIARILAEAGVVENAAMFRLRARLDGIDGQLRSGIYELTTGMSYDAVVTELMTGTPVQYVTVTIPEGLTVQQMADRFAEQAGIPSEQFVEIASRQAMIFAAEHPYLGDVIDGSLEGYLFPKTYRVVEGATAADVIEMMLDQFDAEIATLDLSYPMSRGMTLHEIVTAASIVEREARLEAERPLVASVIYNRLDREMKLEMCATVEYLLPGNRPRLTNADLAIDSPYNTYRYPGLPPGPIAAPGFASLAAVADPADTDYIFYVLTGEDGSHTFAATYNEFLKAKEKSREVVP